MPHDPSAFFGAWHLVDWRIEYPDGSITRPFGEGAHGFIVYTADGIMTASIAMAERARFGLVNARRASDAQKGAAFDSYFHYAGPWRVDGEDVVHAVTLSLNPDMTGTEQRRRAVFDDKGGLILSAHETTKTGEQRHHILEWRRSS